MAELASASLMLTAVLALLSLAGQSVHGSPKHQWPLQKRTVLWDNQEDTNTGSLFGSGNACPHIVADAPFHDGSFFYNGEGLSVADFRIPESGDFDKYGFTLYLRPHAFTLSSSSDVALFEYRSNSQTVSNRITIVLAEVVSGGHVRLTLGTKDNPSYKTLTSTVKLTSSSFQSVLLSAEKGSTMHVTIGNTDKQSGSGATVHALAVPGKWRVGQSQAGTGGISRYRGKIGCISFFDFRVDASEHPSEYRCTDSYSPSGVPNCAIQGQLTLTDPDATTTTPTTTTTTPTTTTTTTPAFSFLSFTLRHLWPLDNVTRGYDVSSRQAPLTSAEDLACLRPASEDFLTSGGGSQGWNGTILPLLWDGSSWSSLSLPVNESVFQSDFTAAVLVKPRPPCEGKLWSLTPSATATSGISLMEVKLEGNCTIIATLWTFGASTPCGRVAAPGALSHRWDSFTLVRVQKRVADLVIRVGSLSWTSGHLCGDCGDNCARGGSLEVGGAEFRGWLVCLAVFGEDVGDVKESVYLDHCQVHHGSSSLQAPDAACDTSPDLQHGHFTLVSRDKRPGPMVGLLPMGDLQRSSVAQCAGTCLHTQHCRSFSVIRANVTATSCLLYDFVTVEGLIAWSGNSYYKLNRFSIMQ